MQEVKIVLLSIVSLLALAAAKPQGLGFLMFKDGNIGVNWGGYQAETGLGGILTGNRTAGGLHASAGTPNGPNAQTGLQGFLDKIGHTGGKLFANAGLGEGGDLVSHGFQGGSSTGAGPGKF